MLSLIPYPNLCRNLDGLWGFPDRLRALRIVFKRTFEEMMAERPCDPHEAPDRDLSAYDQKHLARNKRDCDFS